MLNVVSDRDFVVAEPFRWRAILYKKGSALPAGMPQGAINQFLHRSPPLIKLKSSNGSPVVSRKKKTKKKTSKTRKKIAARKTKKQTARA